jgi:hypothetical protein
MAKRHRTSVWLGVGALSFTVTNPLRANCPFAVTAMTIYDQSLISLAFLVDHLL